MQCSIIQKLQLEGALRLDAEYYQPEYLEFDKRLNAVSHDFLKDLSIRISRGKQPLYVEGGKIFAFTSDQIRDDFIDIVSARYTDEKFYNANPKAQVKPFDVLLNSTGIGTLGRINFYYLNQKAIVDGHITIIRTIVEKLNPIFLNIFLKTKFGQYQINKSYTGSSGQIELYSDQIEDFVIFTPHLKIQNKIANQVLNAIKFQEESEFLYSQAENLLLEELGLKDFEVEDDLSYIVDLSEIRSAHRADAEYFQPKYEKLISKIKKQDGKLLCELVSRIKTKIKPKPEEIYKYIEISDINIGNGDADFNEIVGKELPVNARIPIKGGELLISKVRPTRGAISIVTLDFSDNFICSSAFSVFKAPEILKEYLFVVLHSIVGKLQFEKPTTGTSYPTITDEDIENTLVPILPKSTQQKIADLVQKSHEARKKAKELLEQAKRKVEELIK